MKTIIILLAVLLTVCNVSSQSIKLDTTFGEGGIVRTNIYDGNGGDEREGIVAIQTDGKLIIAMDVDGAYPYIVRINADGSQDNSFKSPVLTKMDLNAMVLGGDGKLTIAGSVYNNIDNTYDFAIARLNRDGSLDASFGSNGKITTDPGTANGKLYSITIQADNRIVVAGYFGSIIAPEFNVGGVSNFILARYNSDGSLDTGFGLNGKVFTDFPSTKAEVYDLALQADGKIVAAGLSGDGGSSPNTNIALARYNTNGSLDSSFSDDGMQVTMLGTVGKAMAHAVTIQDNGKIVIAGTGYNTHDYDFVVARYNENGSLDTGFNAGIPELTDIGGSQDYAFDIRIQADGKIVAGGNGHLLTPGGANSEFTLARYNADGTPDSSFDADGKLTTAILYGNDFINSIAVQTDGKIIACGYCRTGSGTDNALARYNSDGSLDTSFDDDGRLTIFYGSSPDQANAMALQDDGKILVAGDFGTSSALVRYKPNGDLDSNFGEKGKVLNGQTQAKAISVQNDGKILVVGSIQPYHAIWRYTSDGHPDTAFGNKGMTITGISDANAIAVQQDGKIIVAGETFSTVPYFAVARYNNNGSPDSSFGLDGIVVTNFDTSHKYVSVNAMALQADGKIVVAGSTSKNSVIGSAFFALARYTTLGSLDTSFDGDGKQMISPGNAYNQCTALGIQNDGKIIASGSTGYNDTYISEFAIARFNSDGSLDNEFGTNGIATTNFGNSYNYAFANTLQPDGKILVAGSSNLGSDFAVARYNGDGSLDHSFDGDGKLIIDIWDYYNPTNVHMNEEANAIAVYNDRIYIAGTAVGDFVLIRLNNNVALPLEFLEFTGSWYNDNDVLLEWKTSNEENTRSFDIEQSTDGNNFILIGNVISANNPGENQYSFIAGNVASLPARQIYFRLKQRDIDNHFTYSKTVAIPNNPEERIVFYPNPVMKEGNLVITVTETEQLEGRILDNTGRTIAQHQWTLQPGFNALKLNMGKLSAGLYYLQLKGEHTNKNIRFMKP